MDGLTIDLDTTALTRELNELGATAQPFINEASRVTAEAIVREATARLARQLGPHATGKTLAAIASRPAYDGNGYVVVVEREPLPNLPLWLEKGTKAGKPHSHDARPRPFFYVSALLEVDAHERRLAEALSAAIAETGLGDG